MHNFKLTAMHAASSAVCQCCLPVPLPPHLMSRWCHDDSVRYTRCQVEFRSSSSTLHFWHSIAARHDASRWSAAASAAAYWGSGAGPASRGGAASASAWIVHKQPPDTKLATTGRLQAQKTVTLKSAHAATGAAGKLCVAAAVGGAAGGRAMLRPAPGVCPSARCELMLPAAWCPKELVALLDHDDRNHGSLTHCSSDSDSDRQ